MRTADRVQLYLPAAKKQKEQSKEVEQLDLTAFFHTIFEQIAPQGQLYSSRMYDVIEHLSLDHEVLQTFHHIPLLKIKEQFHRFLKDFREAEQHRGIFSTVLNRLYDIALINSSMRTTIAQTERDLPQLQESLRSGLNDKLKGMIHEGYQLLNIENMRDHSRRLKERIDAVDQMLNHLSHYCTFKHYLNEEENTRIIDLAAALARTQAEQQYPRILSDYPHVIRELGRYEGELNQVSTLVQRLHQIKLHLQEKRAINLSHGRQKQDNPLLERFILPFGQPIYETSAKIFWEMLFSSLKEPEVKQMMSKSPHWEGTTKKECNFALFNEALEELFPDLEVEQWILKLLTVIPAETLSPFESQLQVLSKQKEEIRVSPELDGEAKKQIITSCSNEMEELCFRTLKPPARTIAKLRVFLAT